MSPSRTSVPFFLPDDEVSEILDGVEVGVRRQVHLNERAFGAAEGGQKVIPPSAVRTWAGLMLRAAIALRLQPDAHRESAAAENFGALHAAERGEAGLDDSGEIIGDLVRLENIGGEAEVAGGELRIGRLDVDYGDLRFRWKVAADLVDLRADLGKCLVRIVIQFEPRGDRRNALRALDCR